MGSRNNSSIFTIDGRHLISGVHGGVQRFLSEIVAELDRIAKPGDYEICIPDGYSAPGNYQNIPVVKYGKLQGLLWEQVSLPRYLRKYHRYGIYPCSVVPFTYCKGIAVIHDIMFRTVPMVSHSLNPLLRFMITRNYAIAAKKATIVGTVTEYSRKEICKIYNINSDKTIIIPNAWQHFNRIVSDHSWMEMHPELAPGNFYFSLSANRVQKNYKWVYEVALRNPKDYYVIAGTQEEWQKQIEFNARNIIHLGDVSDGIVRSAMEKCKAFLFPSFYEGFGIPPLEALSVGAKIIVSKSSCLPEVYENSAHYIDPNDYDVNLDELLSKPVSPPELLLNKYSWEKSARQLDMAREKILTGAVNL